MIYDALANDDYLCDNEDYDHQCEDKNVSKAFLIGNLRLNIIKAPPLDLSEKVSNINNISPFFFINKVC